MAQAQNLPLDALLAPIPGPNPAGIDIAFEPDYAAIKEARRAEDASLAQGEWQTEIKQADWPKVREMCLTTLKGKSKDLQVAAWLTEAAARLSGFAGLAEGLALMHRLLDGYWDQLHPNLDDGPDGRIGKIMWLRTNLPATLRAIPLTAKEAGGYDYLRYEESRQIENIGRRDPQAMARALADGKLSVEAWTKATGSTPTQFYEGVIAALTRARTELATLIKTCDHRFGADSPSLAELDTLLGTQAQLTGKILRDRGRVDAVEAPLNEPVANEPHTAALPSSGPIATRDDALRRLNEVAQFFRRTEPHSPVAHLCEKAAEWAQMPFDQWLGTVIKDEGSLNHVRELLGIKS